jgi:hypothetical protein
MLEAAMALKVFYERLVATGKAKKVAVVACMRKVTGDFECDC